MREEIVQITERLLQIHQEAASPGTTHLPRYLAASDVHGNIYRLTEILARAEQDDIEHVFLVGDLYSGTGGWSLYKLLRARIASPAGISGKITLMWGNHELAFVAGMLGNDKQLRFFYSYGGQELVQELNAERERQYQPPLTLSASPRLTADDLARLRAQPELQEMCGWIQRTHRLFATDAYGTGYLHAFPKINRHGEFVFQYRGQQGLRSLALIEQDLREATRADHPVFSSLLQTDISPVWALFEISSARQFDHAVRSTGVRQIIFGHRHHTHAVNIGRLNRQVGIAVDFDHGLGGYLLIGPRSLTFRRFVEQESQRTEEFELVAPAGGLSSTATHLHDIEEFLFRRLVQLEQDQFARLPVHSSQARHEFEYLETLRARGFPWIHRLYAELYSHVKDPVLRTDIFTVAVASGDEEAFRSFIHLLYQKTQELESHGKDWYSEPYLLAKSIAQVLMSALRDMPVARLGLLDVRLRGTISRLNLTELYKRILGLEDPELALLAVQNLGMLRTPEADQELRRAFFHDVRKVRVRAAEVLAGHGEVAYPLVAPLLSSSDGWVRGLAMWTLAELARPDAMRLQAIRDLTRVLQREQDWFLYMTGKELLRKLGDPDVAALPDRPHIPNLTSAVIETLQEIVDSEQDPFRRAFHVYYITIELSSLVYRRGLIGLDIDDLRIYVNDEDYFPPYFRHFKSGDRDFNGVWRGWRRLWLRGETLNVPDGPQIIELASAASHKCPTGNRTIVLYDHRRSRGRVELPALEDVIARHGLGKVKDRVRHELLEQWESAFSLGERVLLSRLHAAALRKMLFDLPAEMIVTASDWEELDTLSQKTLQSLNQKSKPILKLTKGDTRSMRRSRQMSYLTAHPLWLDAQKYSVTVYLRTAANV